MEIGYADSDLKQLATNNNYKTKLSIDIVRAYRKLVNLILQAPSRETLRVLRGVRLEKLKGKKQGQYSMRVNDQYRLIVEFKKNNDIEKVIIIRLEDYH